MSSAKQAIAVRHVGFEDLGSFAPVLERRGYAIRYCDAGVDDLRDDALREADLVFVLGGPIGANDEQAYPFLAEELDLIRYRLERRMPMIGICLGAQLIARALGAQVYPGPRAEIGFDAVALTDAGQASCLGPIADLGAVLHWHGDTFDLPPAAVHLASSSVCKNQAFSYGAHVLALQFHLEAKLGDFERWLIGHTGELRSMGLDPCVLRRQAQLYLPHLERSAARVLGQWLDRQADAAA